MAVTRGVTFVAGRVTHTLNPNTTQDTLRAYTALDDVAESLGYAGGYEYNQATIRNPADVRRRLRALVARLATSARPAKKPATRRPR